MKLISQSMRTLIQILLMAAVVVLVVLFDHRSAYGVTIPDSSYTDNGITYTFTVDGDDEVVANVESYHVSAIDTSGKLEIPGQITVPSAGSVKVTGVLRGAFKGCNSLTELTLPQSVDYIGQEAFCNCTGLTKICSTVDPNLDGFLTAKEIGYRAFYGCTQLKSIRLGEAGTSGVKTVQSEAFMNCTALNSVQIDNTVEWIDSGAFANCTSLDGANVKVLDNAKFFVYGGILYYQENDTSSILLCCPANTNVGELTEFPNTVTQIRKQAFYGCKLLTAITIPDTVTSIGDQAFSGCTQLLSVIAPDSLTSIGYRVFENCSDKLVISCTSGTPIDSYALANNVNRNAVCTVTFVNTYTNATQAVIVKNGEKATLPTGWERDGYSLRWSNGFDENTIVNSSMTVSTVWKRLYTVTFKDTYSGQQTVLSGIEEGSSTTPPEWTRKGYTLSWSNQDYMNVRSDLVVEALWLFSMTDGDASQTSQTTYKTGSEFTVANVVYRISSNKKRTLTVIGLAKKMTTVTIPSKLTVNGSNYKITKIAANAFQNNKKMKKITIGKNLLSIGRRAFYNCSKMTKMVIRSKKLDTIGNQAFKKTSASLKVTAPTKGRAKTYRIMMMDAGLNSKAKVVKAS